MKKETKPALADSRMPFKVADVAALQALMRGDASPEQQKRALTWIIEKGAQTYEPEYKTDSRDHAYCSGRRSVGLNIVFLLHADLSKLQQAGHA